MNVERKKRWREKNPGDISKVLPYKSKTVKVKTIYNTFQSKSTCVMELSLLQGFDHNSTSRI